MGRGRIGIAVLVLALANACSSGKSAITTTTTPGPVNRHSPFLRVMTRESNTPCRDSQLAGFGGDLDGKCFTLGATLMSAGDLVSYGVWCPEPSTGWTLELSFDTTGGARFASYARTHVGANVAVVEDGVVVLAPPLNAGIAGRGVAISGANFHASELRRIGKRSGAREQNPETIVPPSFPGSITLTPSPTPTRALIGRCKTNDI